MPAGRVWSLPVDSTLRLKCVAQGEPEPHLIWLKVHTTFGATFLLPLLETALYTATPLDQFSLLCSCCRVYLDSGVAQGFPFDGVKRVEAICLHL